MIAFLSKLDSHGKGAEIAEETLGLRQKRSSKSEVRAFVFSGLSPLNEKHKKLNFCDLCGSAVNRVSNLPFPVAPGTKA